MPALFILWDTRDGAPRRDEDGNLISDGVLGRITLENAYLTAYPRYPDKETRRPADLNVGESIPGVRYSLSGTSGTYTIIRVS